MGKFYFVVILFLTTFVLALGCATIPAANESTGTPANGTAGAYSHAASGPAAQSSPTPIPAHNLDGNPDTVHILGYSQTDGIILTK